MQFKPILRPIVVVIVTLDLNYINFTIASSRVITIRKGI